MQVNTLRLTTTHPLFEVMAESENLLVAEDGDQVTLTKPESTRFFRWSGKMVLIDDNPEEMWKAGNFSGSFSLFRDAIWSMVYDSVPSPAFSLSLPPHSVEAEVVKTIADMCGCKVVLETGLTHLSYRFFPNLSQRGVMITVDGHYPLRVYHALVEAPGEKGVMVPTKEIQLLSDLAWKLKLIADPL